MIAHKLEDYFAPFRNGTIGREQTFETPYGSKRLIYADWTASGRAYLPIEECLRREVMPFIGNTHTSATVTGTRMSEAYETAKMLIKRHVNATHNDVLIFCGSGMTSAVNKLQRILGIRISERIYDFLKKDSLGTIVEAMRPVVFVTHMEHHSNHISWLETIATVEIIRPDMQGNIDVKHLRSLLIKYQNRKYLIAAITACSNVTGIETPYYDIAAMMHEAGGICVVDFAASAPYVTIDMHPNDSMYLDAIFFSCHKFLGGPGTPGVLIMNKSLYRNHIPDHPGGGTVDYTSPWHDRDYVEDIELREDGGTPPILQGIKAGMCIALKEQMGALAIRERENELVRIVMNRLTRNENIMVLESRNKKRLGIVSFIIPGAHYNLVVKLLNDHFGIQVRGGCSCAGTYGHFLLNVNKEQSQKIRESIRLSDNLAKPGWIRLSLHPTMTNAEVGFILDAIEETVLKLGIWSTGYRYDKRRDEFVAKDKLETVDSVVSWFKPTSWNVTTQTPVSMLLFS